MLAMPGCWVLATVAALWPERFKLEPLQSNPLHCEHARWTGHWPHNVNGGGKGSQQASATLLGLHFTSGVVSIFALFRGPVLIAGIGLC